jgi:hypothetical protein
MVNEDFDLVDDGAETEDIEVEDEPTESLGKRLHAGKGYVPEGKRMRHISSVEDVIDLGDEEEDDDEDDDADDSEESSTLRRAFSKNDAKNFSMKMGNSSGLAYEQNQAAPHHKNLQRLLDSMDRKTKTELFSDALEMCGNELFQGHEAWRDQLLIKACRLQPSFVSSINELAHQSGSYNTPVVLSGDEDDDDDADAEAEEDNIDADEDEDEDEEDDEVEVPDDDEIEGVQEVAESGGDEGDLNLVSAEEGEGLELGDLSDL